MKRLLLFFALIFSCHSFSQEESVKIDVTTQNTTGAAYPIRKVLDNAGLRIEE